MTSPPPEISADPKKVSISDGIKTCTSLRTLSATSYIAERIAGMPNLKKIIISDSRKEDGLNNLSVPIDTMVVQIFYIGGHSVGGVYYNFKPRYIIRGDKTFLNAFEPNRTDYKGIHYLPKLSGIDNPQIITPDSLDLSDVCYIPDNYFKNGTMKTIKFSKNLDFVGHDAFKDCKNITSVVFPNSAPTKKGLLTMGLQCFGGCTNLKEVHFYCAVHMDDWCFGECTNLKEVHFFNGVICIDHHVKGNGTTVIFDLGSTVEFTGRLSSFDHFVFNAIPLKLKIGGDDGTKASDIVSYIEIPKGTKQQFLSLVEKKTDLEYLCFEQGVELKTYDIKVEKPGTILSYLPMDELENITSLTVTGLLYETDLKVIKKCVRLSHLDLGKTIITFSPELLKKAKDEQETLGAIFGMIGAMADAKYNNNEMGTLDYSFTKMFSTLMQEATTVTTANDDCIVPTGSFEGMKFLKTVILPYRASRIGSEVLSDCVNLEHVELPLYLESMGRGCFHGCKRLKDIKFPKSLNYMGGGFYRCDSIEIVDLSQCDFSSKNKSRHEQDVKWPNAFRGCKNVKELRLPQGITEFKYGEYNNMKVYFPQSLKEIKESNFENSELHFKTLNAPQISHGQFFGAVIYCPKGSITSYYNAIGYSKNVKIIEE